VFEIKRGRKSGLNEKNFPIGIIVAYNGGGLKGGLGGQILPKGKKIGGKLSEDMGSDVVARRRLG